jgi:DNA-binding CsgD family transcriptional regulator
MEYLAEVLPRSGLAVALDVIVNCSSVETADEFRPILASLDKIVPTENIVVALAQKKGDGLISSRGVQFLSVHPATRFEVWLRALRSAEGDGGLDGLFGSDGLHVSAPIDTTPGTAERDEFCEFANAIGCQDYIVSKRTTERLALQSVCIFAGCSLTIDPRNITIIKLLAPHLHSALIRIGLNLFKPRGALSTREREVLRWIGAGKTSWETSRILQIAERTVIFHVQNAMKKLGATSRAQAIALAFRYELLYVAPSTPDIAGRRVHRL